MKYRRSGKSGLLLPSISMGLWQNFGMEDVYRNMKDIILGSFDCGITHFDLANNYGPPPGEAEMNFGKILRESLGAYRDELVIASKAGYYMWPGPYGDWGSKKYLTASIDQSLKRMGLEYVDIFYSHRPDPNTSIEETMMALDQMVRSGKALYVGISSYNAVQTEEASAVLKSLGTPCLIHQPKYSLLERWVEKPANSQGQSLLDVVEEEGMGCIVFSPLAQGRLSDKYLHGIPADSRAGRGLPNGALLPKDLDEKELDKIRSLNQLALQRNQTLAQMSIAWLLKDDRVTSVLVGASSLQQVKNSIGALDNIQFSEEELKAIEGILS
jgi:L-glyceraldehyde 3-phosphate reductase